MKECHIFDLDGTLVDSMPVFSSGVLRILSYAGVSYPDDVIKIVTPLGYRGVAEYLFSLGVKANSTEELQKTMYETSYAAYANEIEAKAGVGAYLNKLKRSGVRLFVLTASPHLLTDPCLKRIGLYGLFEQVWSTDDFSYAKSDPRIYAQMCEKIGCTLQDIVLYDDNLLNLQTAKEVGVSTVGVYDPSSDSFVEKIKSITDGYIADFNELL